MGDTVKSILLADDSALTRSLVRNLVTERLGHTVTYAEAGSGAEALDKAVASKPDLVILDIAMPGLNGVEAARYVIQRCPKTAVMIISNYNVATLLPQLKLAGIRGFVPKTSMASDLIPAIQALMDGKTYFAGEPAPSQW